MVKIGWMLANLIAGFLWFLKARDMINKKEHKTEETKFTVIVCASVICVFASSITLLMWK